MIFTGLLIALITQLEPAVEWLTPFTDGWARGLATTIVCSSAARWSQVLCC